MEIFIDTADIGQIREAASWGILSGVTTNPTLIARAGHKDFKSAVKEICKIVQGPISAEVLSLKAEEMVRDAEKLGKIHKNVIIKIPMCPEGLKAIKALSKKGIKVNCTLVFSANQALLAAIAGAAYVSPFVGRLDDIGNDGMKVVAEILQVFRNYGFGTKVIVASVRHPMHVVEAALLGADIATVPFDVLKKMISHAKTDEGIKRFMEDAKKTKQKI